LSIASLKSYKSPFFKSSGSTHSTIQKRIYYLKKNKKKYLKIKYLFKKNKIKKKSYVKFLKKKKLHNLKSIFKQKIKSPNYKKLSS
jgi:hypothetical protein